MVIVEACCSCPELDAGGELSFSFVEGFWLEGRVAQALIYISRFS